MLIKKFQPVIYLISPAHKTHIHIQWFCSRHLPIWSALFVRNSNSMRSKSIFECTFHSSAHSRTLWNSFLFPLPLPLNTPFFQLLFQIESNSNNFYDLFSIFRFIEFILDMECLFGVGSSVYVNRQKKTTNHWAQWWKNSKKKKLHEESAIKWECWWPNDNNKTRAT